MRRASDGPAGSPDRRAAEDNWFFVRPSEGCQRPRVERTVREGSAARIHAPPTSTTPAREGFEPMAGERERRSGSGEARRPPRGGVERKAPDVFRVRWAPRGDRPHEAAAQGLSPSPRGRPPELSAPQFPSARRIRRFNDAPRHPVRAPPTRSVRDERKTGRTSGGRHRLRAGAPARPVRVREAYRLGRLSPRGARRNAEVVRDGATHGVPGRFETLPTCGGARQGSAAADTAPIASCFEGRSESARDPEGGPEPRTVARGGEEPTSAARTPPASTKGRLTGVMPT